MSPTEISELALARSRVYRALSIVYMQPPSQGLLETLLGESHLLSLSSLSPCSILPEKLLSGLKAIHSFAEELNSDLVGKVADALSVEYTRLFRGVKHSYGPPPPYESVYTGEGIVFGQTTMAVYRAYHESGFTSAEQHRGEPPDHISLELEFMQSMCATEVEAWRKRDQDEALRLLNAEKRFLEEHLARWVPEFCENVRRCDRVGFYRHWADVTEGWISFDHQLIDDYKAVVRVDGASNCP